MLNNLWHLQWSNGVHAYKAWDQLTWIILSPVNVGIVDDGFYVSHEDLSIASAVPAWAWGWHGTHVAWLVGALTNNGKWIASAARNSGNIQIKWYNYHFWQWDNDWYKWSIMSLVEQAVEDGAKVINMSWWVQCWYWYSRWEAQIFQSLYNQWIVLIAGAWNSRHPLFDCPNVSQPDYPARYPWVISVGNSTEWWNLASSSNPGADILSPWTNIESTCIGWWYCKYSGTSMASPIAASVAALLLSIDSWLTPDQIESILIQSKNPKWVINACNAVAILLWNDPALVCGDDENTWWDIWENCLWDTECQSWVCEEIIEGKCISGQYGEKPECKWFTTKEQCLSFKQDVWTWAWWNYWWWTKCWRWPKFFNDKKRINSSKMKN